MYIPINGASVRYCEFSYNYRTIALWTSITPSYFWLVEGVAKFSHGYTLQSLAVLVKRQLGYETPFRRVEVVYPVRFNLHNDRGLQRQDPRRQVGDFA